MAELPAILREFSHEHLWPEAGRRVSEQAQIFRADQRLHHKLQRQSEYATSDDLFVSRWHGLPTLARYRGCLSRSTVFLPYGLDRSIHLGGTVVNLQTQTPPDYDDYQQHFVVPNGCIDCPGLEPYVGFINWCRIAISTCLSSAGIGVSQVKRQQIFS